MSRCVIAGFVTALAGAAVSCDSPVVQNQTASLGSATAGQRGNVRVLFINNTPHRAVFTYGTHSNTDRTSNPDFSQFTGNMAFMTLEGNATSAIDTLLCDRVFSVGGPELLSLIERNGNLNSPNFSEAAFMTGVMFSSAALGTPEAELPTEGLAPAIERFIGVDFPCGALLIVRLEEDSGEPPLRFRTDFTMIPAESDR